jgi:hypothetical protein
MTQRGKSACPRTGKRRYRDRIAAMTALARAEYVDWPQCRVYRCEFCRGWHMTSQAKR